MGKPDPVIYQAAMSALGGLRPSEVLAIGDSLEHDIAGAAAAGIDSLFIGAGIHAKELGVFGAAAAGGEGAGKQGMDRAALETLCREFGAVPTYATSLLMW